MKVFHLEMTVTEKSKVTYAVPANSLEEAINAICANCGNDFSIHNEYARKQEFIEIVSCEHPTAVQYL